jgi:hypothetical protein
MPDSTSFASPCWRCGSLDVHPMTMDVLGGGKITTQAR